MIERIPDSAIREARSKRPISAVVGTYVPLRKAGSEYAALCPFHKERSPSFFVNDEKGIFKCFGCGAFGDAIAAVMQLGHRSFADAVTELLGAPPVLESATARFTRQWSQATEEYAATDGRFDTDAKDRARLHEARAIWRNRQPLKGSIAERYLIERRRLRGPWPETLAFSPSLYYVPARAERPALIAALHDSGGELCAVQRIYLDPETADKAEPRKQAKRTKGPMRDGAVRLAKAGRLLGIAEGIETALSAARTYSLPVWASLGAQRMKSLGLPPGVAEVMIFRDNGEVGLKEAAAAAEVFEDRGHHVFIEAPPKEFDDWNDYFANRSGGT